MKNIFKVAAVTVAVLSTSVGVAAADTVCGTITNTGSGSSNNITCVDNTNTQVTCTNNVVVSGTNNQNANSGNANNSGNTTSGGATSGNANNSNTSVVTVGASCTPAAGGNGGDFTVVDTPVTPAPSTPQVLGDQIAVKPVGGVGAGAGAGVATNKVAATTGIVASAALVVAGFALRKRIFNN